MVPSQMYARSALSTAIWPRKLANSAFVPTPLAQPDAVFEAPPPASTVTAASEVYHAAVGDTEFEPETDGDAVATADAVAAAVSVVEPVTDGVTVADAVFEPVAELVGVAVKLALTVHVRPSPIGKSVPAMQ